MKLQKKLHLILFLAWYPFSFTFSQAWTQITTTGAIAPRSNASAIYISSQNKMFVFGGNTAAGNVNELWCLDLNSNNWSLVPTNSAQLPAPRYTHVSMYDSLLNRMLIWSGQGSALYNDVWAFNFNDSTWTELFADGNVAGAPLKRYGTATVFDPLNRNIINFAGFTTAGRFDDTWSFKLDSLNWTDQTNTFFPLRRCLTSQSFAEDRRAMIVFGGQSTGNLNDIWSLNADTYVWTDLTPVQSPPSRHFPSNVYSGNGNIIVFGGNSLNQGNISGGLNDLWRFNLDTQLWDTLPQSVIKPLQRFGHSAIYIPSQDKMIIFGGQGTSSILSDTWEYTGISTVGISNISNESSINIFPNPVSGLLNIKINNSSNIKSQLKITNVLGENIFSKEIQNNETIVDMSTLQNGIYFVKIENEYTIQTKQIIVNK
ncbi:MAG: kelch repeat-containing protein [Bacteroidota bacterium]